MNPGTAVVGIALLQKFSQKLLEVAEDCQVRPHGGLMELGGVDIDLNLESVGRERLPVITGLADIEPRSENQENVGILHREVSGAVTDGALSPTKERVVGGNEVMGPGGGDGYAQPVKQFVEFGGRIRRADAGAGENHRTLGIPDAVENLTAVGCQPGGSVRHLVMRGP